MWMWGACIIGALAACGGETNKKEGEAATSAAVPESEVLQPSMERNGDLATFTGNALIFFYPSEAELAQREPTEPDVRERSAAHEALFNSLKTELGATIPMHRTDAPQLKITISEGQVRIIERRNIPEPFGMILYSNGREVKLVRQDLTAELVRAEVNAYLGE
jgi:hypothetical protein